MTTSIVIPVFNGLEFLKQNLPSVVGLKTDEIVIVDDASKDGSADFVSSKFPQIKLITHSQNTGFTRSVNDGFAQAAGDLVFLLNQDVTPAPDLVKKARVHFTNPQVFAVTFNENKNAYAEITWEKGFLQYKSGSPTKTPHSSAWASGGSAVFRRETWNQLGGFDPIFSPGYYEDLDLGLTATEAGYQIIWDPNTQVDHVREASFKKEYSPQALQRLKDRNYLLVQWKHLPKGQKISHILAITKRVLAHPGFVTPLLMAIYQWIIRKSL